MASTSVRQGRQAGLRLQRAGVVVLRSTVTSRLISASAAVPVERIVSSDARVTCWIVLDDLLGGAGLHDDRADRVGHDVVQLARDPGALLHHRGQGPLRSRDLGLDRAPLGLAGAAGHAGAG